MSLKSALQKIGSVVGDVAKTAFNAIPLVPNIPASKFSNPGIAKASGILSGVTDLAGDVVSSIVPGGNVVKGAIATVSSLIPSTKNESKSSSALPSSIPTNGFVSRALQSTVKPLASALLPSKDAVPNTIGLFQQASAAPSSSGTKVNVPINSSGIGYFTQDVPPVTITNTGQIASSIGLLGQAPAGLSNPSGLLPTSDPLEKISEVVKDAAAVKNKSTNPSTPEQLDKGSNVAYFALGLFALIGLLFGLLSNRRK